MSDETPHPWDRQEGESSRWYQRFCAYRLLGPGRSVLECVRQEKATKGNERQQFTPGSWSRASEAWQWKTRAEAWDRHVVEQADAAIEREWRGKIMGETEILGRMSEYGRNDMGQFFKVIERWTEAPLPSEEILGEQKYPDLLLPGIEHTRYLVRKAVLDMEAFLDPVRSRKIRKFTDSPKNGLGIELHDSAAAQVNLGRHHKLFSVANDVAAERVDAHPFSLPADVLAPSFIKSYRAVKSDKYTEFLEYGGRGYGLDIRP